MNEDISIREPRFRVSASRTAKGFIQVDATVEMSKPKQNVSDPKDISDTTEKPIGQILFDMMKETEDIYRKNGNKIAGDKEE